MNNQGGMQGGNNPLPVAPGLNAVIGSCHRLYPTQKNPLQVKILKPKKISNVCQCHVNICFHV